MRRARGSRYPQPPVARIGIGFPGLVVTVILRMRYWLVLLYGLPWERVQASGSSRFCKLERAAKRGLVECLGLRICDARDRR